MNETSNHCPCGSGKNYNNCCQPFHLKEGFAPNAEQLMRSRYTAYALGGLGEYLYSTWHANYRESLNIDDLDAVDFIWRKLIVLDFVAHETRAEVEFIAVFDAIDNGNRQYLQERSNFVLERGQWFYTDGLIQQVKLPKRNEDCICKSGKKFKKCCG